MIFVLYKRKFRTFLNKIKHLSGWEILKNLLFILAGSSILTGLFFGFLRVLRYLEKVEIIGPVLSWKLTSMVLLITFSMIVISGIIISMTTLFYSSDLKFLFSCPVRSRVLFLDKAVETTFYSSWTLVLAIFPYVLAFGHVKSLELGFYISYILLMIPFIMIASSAGIIFSMIVMYLFPSSKTRDVAWILGSFSVAIVYMVVRFSRPEKLARPDVLEAVAEYLQFLQAPTMTYLPSWWLTKAMMSLSAGKWMVFAEYASLLVLVFILIYSFMYYLSGFLYTKGFNGAQEGRKFKGKQSLCFEQKLVLRNFPFKILLTLLWKDRLLFVRDARYWSQVILIIALIMVYLFSVRQLPVDTPALKSIVSFLNIGVAGFVVAAVGLRFTFPSISLENGNYWILKSAPVSPEKVMTGKLLISGIPSIIIGVILISFSNYLLKADAFISGISLFTIIIASFVISVMGVGFGAIFPDFRLENIHQIESSYGGFIYMITSIGYLFLVISIEAWPVKMHFMEKFGKPDPWSPGIIIFCAATFAVLNFFAAAFFWKLGLKNLERLEN